MESKVCTRCKLDKPVSEFCKCAARKDGLQPACKSCMNDSYTRSRNKKLDHYQQTSNKWRAARAKEFTEWKQQHPCIKCGENDVSCLDLHHLDPATKETSISDVMWRWSWERLKQEIDKCVVLCSNCHRKYHVGRFEI